jgi:hypothetical protein
MKNENSKWYVYSKDWIYSGDKAIATIQDTGSRKEMDDNAKLICEAVNNYQSLKESNEALIEALNAIIDRAGMRFPHFEKGTGLETINKAKEALNKAKTLTHE